MTSSRGGVADVRNLMAVLRTIFLVELALSQEIMQVFLREQMLHMREIQTLSVQMEGPGKVCFPCSSRDFSLNCMNKMNF